MPFTLAISLVFKSRVGLVKFKIRTISYVDKLAIWPKIGAYRNRKSYLPCQLVFLHAPEVQQIVKVEAGELSFPKNLVAELASAFHYSAEHLIIASACE